MSLAYCLLAATLKKPSHSGLWMNLQLD